MNLKSLELPPWFQDQIDPEKQSDHEIVRVIAVHRDSYMIRNGQHDTLAEITGKLMFNADSPLDFPTVGDWVYARYFDDDTFAVIHDILPRKTILKRKTAGKRIEFQAVAANIDTAFIMQSLDFNFNLRRLERYLVMVNESRIRPVVLLSKSDLLAETELEDKIADIRQIMPDITITAFSNISRAGLDMVTNMLVSGETFCLLGSSGVGKTTLINNLLGEEAFETRAIREKDGKGRHTTTTRQLHVLENGSMIIDTPGMRELGNIGTESGIQQTFDEISELADKCRFTDCSHVKQDGCAVLAALKDGMISEKRYQNFIKMNRESEHLKMSYLEKRRKDKNFGKMIKSIMKNNVKK